MPKESPVRILRLRRIDKDIFEAIRVGKKRIETRAATKRYQKIQQGNRLEFRCGRLKFQRRVIRVRIFKSIPALLRVYPIHSINPFVQTSTELRKLYYTFSGYREKIKKVGLVAFELE